MLSNSMTKFFSLSHTSVGQLERLVEPFTGFAGYGLMRPSDVVAKALSDYAVALRTSSVDRLIVVVSCFNYGQRFGGTALPISGIQHGLPGQ